MRESARAAFLFTVILALLLILAAAWRSQAHAHDWYTGYRNPVSGWGCCGSRDCFSVPLTWISEDEDNYIVTIPTEQSQIGTNHLTENVAGMKTVQHNVFKFPKAEAMPTPHWHGDPSDPLYNPEETGYHACIWGGRPRCFFFPAGS